ISETGKPQGKPTPALPVQQNHRAAGARCGSRAVSAALSSGSGIAVLSLAKATNLATYKKSATKKYSKAIASKSAANMRGFVTAAATANDKRKAMVSNATRIAVLTIEISSNSSRQERMSFTTSVKHCQRSPANNDASDKNQFEADQTLAIKSNAIREKADTTLIFGRASRLIEEAMKAAKTVARSQAELHATVTSARDKLIAKQASRLAPGVNARRASVAWRPRALTTIQNTVRIEPA